MIKATFRFVRNILGAIALLWTAAMTIYGWFSFFKSIRETMQDRIKARQPVVHVTRVKSGQPVCQTPDEDDFVQYTVAKEGQRPCDECYETLRRQLHQP